MRAVLSFVLLTLVGLLGCRGVIGDSEGSNAPSERTGGSGVGSGTTTGGTNPGATGTGGTGGPGTALDCSQASVGVAPLRRLTRGEYAGSVESLFGIAVAADTLPADERVGAFPSNLAAVATLDAENYFDS